MNKYTVRVNLKTGNREKLIEFCLENQEKQFISIGWSSVHENSSIHTFDEYYSSVFDAERREAKDAGKAFRTNPSLNIFRNTTANDLFWTRDLNGYYWVCRAKGSAEPYYDKSLDIGAVIPVEAYKYGLNVPGQIKAAFNRANGGTTQLIKDEKITEFTKRLFNQLSNRVVYTTTEMEISRESFIDNLPDCDLEELVISYLQIDHCYYLLSNSIANKSTTVGIECVLYSRTDKNDKAVLQVKAKEKNLKESLFENFIKDGYTVYLYDGGRSEATTPNGKVNYISKAELVEFYYKYREILPESITRWEDLYAIN